MDVVVHYLCHEMLYIHFKVEDLLDGANAEGALRIMEDLVTATEHLKTPIFPRDLNIAISVVNTTLTQLFLNHETNINSVSAPA